MELDDALRELLPAGTTGDTRADLIAAARETWARRQRNTLAGAAILAALRDAGVSYRDIEAETQIPKTTAQRWATPPGRGDERT